MIMDGIPVTEGPTQTSVLDLHRSLSSILVGLSGYSVSWNASEAPN
jgi:hypothetical protein